MESKRTFYIKTFGCAMNYADSEKVHRILLQSGYLKVLDVTRADIVVLNTCSVRQKWEDKVFGFIHEVRKAAEVSGKTPLIGVTGCMTRKTGIAKRYLAPEKSVRNGIERITLQNPDTFGTGILNWDDPLLWRSEDIDFVFRIEETGGLTKILSIIFNEDIGNDEKWESYLQVEQVRENATSAQVIIQTGCDNYCTFCIVPYTRGREVSRSSEEIVLEVQKAKSEWVLEVNLLGQNVNSYGKLTRAKLWNTESLTWENPEVATPFRALLEAVSAQWVDRIRFTSSNPHDMTRDILAAHFELPGLCNYIHSALQSGSDAVLARMNRKHTLADFRAQVEYLRARDPLFAISTDIIVGFPGETEVEFDATAQAMRELDFDFAYIARYSARSGTRASTLPDDVTPAEKARRWTILSDILGESITRRAKLMIGRTEEILISGRGAHGNWVGRTRNFKEVFIQSEANLMGQLVTIRITELNDWVLRGELVSR
jgi:tRNA-2-methylthio-N6-dimethylallyladenosine synthase